MSAPDFDALLDRIRAALESGDWDLASCGIIELQDAVGELDAEGPENEEGAT